MEVGAHWASCALRTLESRASSEPLCGLLPTVTTVGHSHSKSWQLTLSSVKLKDEKPLQTPRLELWAHREHVSVILNPLGLNVIV